MTAPSAPVIELSKLRADMNPVQAVALLQAWGFEARVVDAMTTSAQRVADGYPAFDASWAGTRTDKETPHFLWTKGGLAQWQVRRVTEFIDSNLARQVTIPELAALVSLSPFHFARAFRASTGLPPRRFQTERRIARAETLLLETDRSISQIALELGFADAGYLSRLLKRERGLTATGIRRAR